MIFLREVPRNMKSHVLKVLDGEYDVQIEFTEPPTVIDIGANIGSFSIWALHRWNAKKIIAYEPIKENFDMLVNNSRPYKDRIQPLNSAVLKQGDKKSMFHGLNNPGECSFFDLGEQDTSKVVGVDVTTVHDTPDGDVLKIDAEGAEVEIVEALAEEGRLAKFKVILMEYHSEADRKRLDDLLKDFTLCGSESHRFDRGVVKYIRTDLIDYIRTLRKTQVQKQQKIAVSPLQNALA